MSSLIWKPQAAFAPHFLTNAKDILKKRTIFTDNIVYHVNYGGRGAAKTWTWADALVVESAIRQVRILITREFQISIEESIKDEIEAAISLRELDHFFTITKTAIVGANGSKFIFKGIKNNIKNLKSISNVEIVLCEEAENIQKNSWDKLLPSIRPKSGKAPIFIILFNPDNELDDTYSRWVLSPPEKSLSRLVNWRDNKYFPDFLNDQRLHCLKTQPKRDYDHIWEGSPTSSGGDAIIDLEWIKAARFASNNKYFKKSGSIVASYDPAGQGKDANAVVLQDGNIIISAEEWIKSDDLRVATYRALDVANKGGAVEFRFDTCGGLGDGVDVFAKDKKALLNSNIKITPFDAGAPVVDPKKKIPGVNRTWGDLYTNAKAQAHAITSQKLYNTYRFIKLGERDILADDMISINIADDEMFKKIAKELSTPIWVKSDSTSKKKVEAKDKMKKRTGQDSPNISDSIIMCNAKMKSTNRIHIG